MEVLCDGLDICLPLIEKKDMKRTRKITYFAFVSNVICNLPPTVEDF